MTRLTHCLVCGWLAEDNVDGDRRRTPQGRAGQSNQTPSIPANRKPRNDGHGGGSGGQAGTSAPVHIDKASPCVGESSAMLLQCTKPIADRLRWACCTLTHAVAYPTRTVQSWGPPLTAGSVNMSSSAALCRLLKSMFMVRGGVCHFPSRVPLLLLFLLLLAGLLQHID